MHALIRNAALALLLAPAIPAAAQESKTVAVTSIVEHPALDAVRDGVREGLKAGGYVEGENLTFEYQSAQGNPATAAQIARQFVGEEPDVIVPISTPSAQAVVAATQDIPVVFSAITDPLGARLVPDLKTPGGNVTGTVDLAPVDKHLDLIREVLPAVRTVGVVYNPGESNSLTILRLMKEAAAARGLEVTESAAPRSSDVAAAARQLVGRAEAIYVPTDNTVVSALEAVLKVGADNDLPVFTGDTDSVERGAVASLGFDYHDVGRGAAEIVIRVLKGEDPGSIPVEAVDAFNLYVNPKAAEAMGVALPAALVDRADVVVR